MCRPSQSVRDNAHPGLYVVATPIGNLGDLSPRARDLLEAADVVAAEDTRSLRTLLGSPGRSGESVSLTEHNVESRIGPLLERAEEGVVALISDAGTPAIADPGTRLVSAAHDAGVAVYTVPGPSALAAALSVSGFATAPATFLGFLPKKSGERQAALRAAATAGGTLVFYESPRRIGKCLEDVAEVLDNPRTVVCRELTKLHEEVVRGPAAELAERMQDARGECTVVVEGGEASKGASVEALTVLAAMRRAGAQRSPAAAEVARLFGLKRSQIYQAWDEV